MIAYSLQPTQVRFAWCNAVNLVAYAVLTQIA